LKALKRRGMACQLCGNPKECTFARRLSKWVCDECVPSQKRRVGRARPSVTGKGSGLEGAVYLRLLERQARGEIRDLKCQQRAFLQDGANDVRIEWTLDFSYVDCATGELCYAEAKGVGSPDYAIKLKLWRTLRPHRLEIWKGHYESPRVVEVIERRAA
jgi:hypothetical protein